MRLSPEAVLFLLQGVSVENPMLARVCRDLAKHMSENNTQQAKKKQRPDTEQTGHQNSPFDVEAYKAMTAFFDSLTDCDRRQTENFLREELMRQGITDTSEQNPCKQQSSGASVHRE